MTSSRVRCRPAASFPPTTRPLRGSSLPLEGPVAVHGELQATEGEDFLWRGSIHAMARLDCRRCLADVDYRVVRQVDVMLTSDPEAADDPSVYPLPEAATQVDVGAGGAGGTGALRCRASCSAATTVPGCARNVVPI